MKKILFMMVCALILSACKMIQTPQQMAAFATQTRRYNPVASKINVQLGLGYLERHAMRRAKHKLLTALQQAPDLPLANDAMAYFEEVTGNIKRAEQYYLHAISLAPTQGETLNNYGAFLFRQKRYEQAGKYFMAAVKDPNYISVAGAYENAGLCALKEKKPARAQHYFKMAVKQDPLRRRSFYALADIAYKLKHYRDAEKYLQSFTRLSGKLRDTTSMLLRYRVAKELGQYAKAARYAILLKRLSEKKV